MENAPPTTIKRKDMLAIKKELLTGVDNLFGDKNSMGHRICTLWVKDADNYRPIIDKYVKRGFPMDQIGLILLQDYLYKIHSVLDDDPTHLGTDCPKNRTVSLRDTPGNLSCGKESTLRSDSSLEHGETFGIISLEALHPGETVKLLDGYCYSLQELREFGEHGTRKSPVTRRSFTNDEQVLFHVLTKLPMTQLSSTYRSLGGRRKTRRKPTLRHHEGRLLKKKNRRSMKKSI